jgi:hypothetical protein
LKTIVLTLFEEQIIRNYTSDSLDLIFNLSTKNRLFIFTNKQNYALISNLLKNTDRNNIKIYVLKLKRINFYEKFLLSMTKWSHPTTTILREIKLTDTQSRSKLFLRYIKLGINFFSKYTYGMNSIISYLLHKTFDRRKFLAHLSPKLESSDLKNFQSAFITSLTNIYDIQVAHFVRSTGVKVIGTVRSWDNLTSHGNLIFKPNFFYSHSQFMTETLTQFHHYDRKKIITLSSPNYRKSFSPIKMTNISYPLRKIGYGCMGSPSNPDDLNMIIEFNKIAGKYRDKEFFVIQHPIFPHRINFELSPNLKILQYDYRKFELTQYYSELSKLDILVAGGSSILLDALFLQIPIAFIGFEVIKQDYWKSALRYEDYVYHFQKFIELTGVRKIRSKDELISLFDEKLLKRQVFTDESVKYFTGDTELDLNFNLTRLLD